MKEINWNQLTSLTPHGNHDHDPDRGGEGHSDSDEDNPESNVSFARLSANSMITAQRWPWTQLVELTTDRKFYRNEIENIFQFHPPKEFHDETTAEGNTNAGGGGGGYTSKSFESEHEPTSTSQKPQRRRLGVVNSSQGMDKNATNRQGGSYLSSLNLENSNMFLREKFNTELQSRRQHFRKAHHSNRESDVYGHGDGGGRDVEEEDDDDEEKRKKKMNRHLAAFEPPPECSLGFTDELF